MYANERVYQWRICRKIIILNLEHSGFLEHTGILLKYIGIFLEYTGIILFHVPYLVLPIYKNILTARCNLHTIGASNNPALAFLKMV